MWRTVLGIGRSALGGGGLWFVLGAFALGAAPSVWLGLSLLGARADLVECARSETALARAETQNILSEVERLNDAAARVRRASERLTEGSDAFRESIGEIDFSCDLEPVADRVQRRIDEVRSDGEAGSSR